MHLCARCGSVKTVGLLLDAGMESLSVDRDMFFHKSLQLVAQAGHLPVARHPHERDRSMARHCSSYGD